MVTVLTKLFSGIMSIVVFLSSAFPAMFDGKVYIDPYGNDVLIGDESPFYINDIDAPVIVSDYETAVYYAERCSLDPDDINEKFFDKYNMVYIPVTLPNTANKIHVNSIVENGNVLEVDYFIVHDSCVGGAMVSFSSILICTSKNIEQVELNEKTITLPLCVH